MWIYTDLIIVVIVKWGIGPRGDSQLAGPRFTLEGQAQGQRFRAGYWPLCLRAASICGYYLEFYSLINDRNIKGSVFNYYFLINHCQKFLIAYRSNHPQNFLFLATSCLSEGLQRYNLVPVSIKGRLEKRHLRNKATTR